MDLNDLAKAIQLHIYSVIPIVQAFDLQVMQLTEDSCTVFMPLQVNRNHKGTAFGGSLYTACVIAAYALVYSKQKSLLDLDLVIREGNIRYLGPVDKDFYTCARLDLSDWNKMMRGLNKKDRARILVTAEAFISEGSEALCEFKGDFVFLKNPI